LSFDFIQVYTHYAESYLVHLLPELFSDVRLVGNGWPHSALWYH